MPDVTTLELIVFGIVTFIAAILSGIAGSGGGFIVTPLLIFIGLSPAQAVATGKFCGLSISLGSLSGMRRIPHRSKKLLFSILFLTVAVGLTAPIVITRLEGDVYRRIIGLLLLVMIPVLIMKKIGRVERQTSRIRKTIGLIVIALSLCLAAVFSSGLGTFVNISLMAFMGMSALEANVTKRYTQAVLNSVVLLGLVGSGLIIWQVALVGAIGSGAGGFVGGRLAVKRGNAFVMSFFVGLMFLAAMWLLFG